VDEPDLLRQLRRDFWDESSYGQTIFDKKVIEGQDSKERSLNK